jgi:hypothetical protein
MNQVINGRKLIKEVRLAPKRTKVKHTLCHNLSDQAAEPGNFQ